MLDTAPTVHGVYPPRGARSRRGGGVVSDHLHRLKTVHDERFAREYGTWRPVVAQVADKNLARGVLNDWFASIPCDVRSAR